MKIEIASAKAREVAERWKAQYRTPSGWKQTLSGSSEAIYDALLKAPDDPQEIAKIVGNHAWTFMRCNSCDENVLVAALFGYDETVHLCKNCLKAASIAMDAVCLALNKEGK